MSIKIQVLVPDSEGPDAEMVLTKVQCCDPRDLKKLGDYPNRYDYFCVHCGRQWHNSTEIHHNINEPPVFIPRPFSFESPEDFRRNCLGGE